MGQEVLRAVTSDPRFELKLALDRTFVGQNVGELIGTESPVVLEEKLGAALDREPVDVLIDFSHHSAAVSHSLSAIQRGVRPVIGCTGLSDSGLGEIRSACRETEVGAMYIPNFAIGAVLMMRFAQMAAKWMPDAEIIELHHDRKEDAPSGTAMLTADLIAQGRVSDPTRLPTPLMKAEGARGGKVSGVPIHSVRLPGLLAHQQVMFGGPGEVLTLRHDSMDRKSFMHGVKLSAVKVLELKTLVIGLDKILFES